MGEVVKIKPSSLVESIMSRIRRLLPCRFGGSIDNIWKGALLRWRYRHFRRLIREVAQDNGSDTFRIMEIGIRYGDTARLMINEARKTGANKIEFYGFDLFEDPHPEGEVYSRGEQAWGEEKIASQLKALGVKFRLFKGNSRVTLPLAVPNLPKMNVINIDGGHSYETAKSDILNSPKLLAENSVLAVHDYGPRWLGVVKAVDEIGGFDLIPCGECKQAIFWGSKE